MGLGYYKYNWIMIEQNGSYFSCVFVDDSPLLSESKEVFVHVVNCFDDVCRSNMLKMNASKSKIFIFEIVE